MRKKVLLFGENPFSFTGNGNMMNAILSNIDMSEYEVLCLCAGAPPEVELHDIFKVMPINVVYGSSPADHWGLNYILRTLNSKEINVFVTVGVDIWRFSPIMEQLRQMLSQRNTPWVSIMPYDFPAEDEHVLNMMSAVDIKCIYSQYGTSIVEKHLPNVEYYRPYLFASEVYQKLPKEVCTEFTTAHYGTLEPDSFIFGFVGVNQHRKEPQKVIQAFLKAQKILEGEREISLYMHTEPTGVYNLMEMGKNWDITKPSSMVFKRPGVKYPVQNMVHMYSTIDCFMLPSLHEGLSWTPLEAMLCELPVLLSDTTAHKELVTDKDFLIPCTVPAYVPIQIGTVHKHVETMACTVDDIVERMVNIVRRSKEDLVKIGKANRQFALDWCDGATDLNEVIEETLNKVETGLKGPEKTEKNGRILFAQHSSGGDVLMTTLCFKGIKERHPGMPLDFMTMPQYMGIVEGNPYIDRVIPWDESLYAEYSFAYNPHAERILPGHWGRNANSILADFYWKIIKVEPDEEFGIVPDANLPDWILESINQELPICIVHTTGGDPEFRTYKYMSDVCEMLEGRYYTIQMGGADDYPAAADLDLRGQITYRQQAWLMKQASVCVSVDSFVSHLAGAMGTSQIALYGSGNAAVCQPKQLSGKLITMSPDYIRYCPGLGPCSASVRDCPITCTSLHNPIDIISAIDELESKGDLK